MHGEHKTPYNVKSEGKIMKLVHIAKDKSLEEGEEEALGYLKEAHLLAEKALKNLDSSSPAEFLWFFDNLLDEIIKLESELPLLLKTKK